MKNSCILLEENFTNNSSDFTLNFKDANIKMNIKNRENAIKLVEVLKKCKKEIITIMEEIHNDEWDGVPF